MAVSADHPAGNRVRLCPFEGEFWDLGLSWYNDPEIIDLTSDDPEPLTAEQFHATISGDLENTRSRVFGIRTTEGRPIGIGLLRNVDPVHGGCDLHITIGERDHWGRGYGAEAISLMRDFAFGPLGLHKVLSTPFVKNPRMIRCLEKCGFEREGLLRDAIRQGGRFIDVMIMAAINRQDGRLDPETEAGPAQQHRTADVRN
jgi:RimJ/RimL family protein N-acetyltransferase